MRIAMALFYILGISGYFLLLKFKKKSHEDFVKKLLCS
jgi:hypothetical protein